MDVDEIKSRTMSRCTIRLTFGSTGGNIIFRTYLKEKYHSNKSSVHTNSTGTQLTRFMILRQLIQLPKHTRKKRHTETNQTSNPNHIKIRIKPTPETTRRRGNQLKNSDTDPFQQKQKSKIWRDSLKEVPRQVYQEDQNRLWEMQRPKARSFTEAETS